MGTGTHIYGPGLSTTLMFLKHIHLPYMSPQVKNLPVGATFYDIDFDPAKPDHGYIVGAKGTFLETNDGGKTWTPR